MTARHRQHGVKFLAAAGSALLVLLMAWVAHDAVTEARNAHRWVLGSLGTRGMVSHVIEELQDAEAGQRGYLLTGDAQHLEPYRQGATRVAASFERLASVTREDPEQQQRIARIRPLLAAKLNELALGISLYDGNHRGEALRMAREPAGAQISAELRQLLEAMRAHVETRLVAHMATFERRVTLARWILVGGALVAFALVMGVHVLMRRDVQLLEHANQTIAAQSRRLASKRAALERSNRDLDQFAYVASHDLKAPLRGIASLAQWIADDGGDRLDEQGREHLRLLQGRVRRMEALIDGILAYSRAGRGGSREPVDVAKLVRQTAELLAPPPGATVVVHPGLPTLTTAKVPLQQVFMNLIGNALKHGGERVTVRVSGVRAGPGWVFTVRDDGPGIDRRFHDKIFGIFQTLTPRDRLESTGIGLAVVKKLVESRGGRVWIESEPGRGAAFHFTWSGSDGDTTVV